MKKGQWHTALCLVPGGEAVCNAAGLYVVVTTDKFPNDPRRWLHISVSHEDRYPTWEELMSIKDEFMGEEVEAYQVLPRHSEHVNVSATCFHLWHCLSGDIMPH